MMYFSANRPKTLTTSLGSRSMSGNAAETDDVSVVSSVVECKATLERGERATKASVVKPQMICEIKSAANVFMVILLFAMLLYFRYVVVCEVWIESCSALLGLHRFVQRRRHHNRVSSREKKKFVF